MRLTVTSVTGPAATTGALSFDANPAVLYTIERSPDDAIPCLPAGVYFMIPYMSPEHGPTWCLHNPALGIYGNGDAPPGGHDYCELHSMNFATQSRKCIGIGLASTTGTNPDTGNIEPMITGGLHGGMALLLRVLEPMSSGHTLSITRASM